MASELERRLKSKPDSFLLKSNVAAKADVWKKFSLVYEKTDSNDDDAAVELKYFCACNKCRKSICYTKRATAVATVPRIC